MQFELMEILDSAYAEVVSAIVDRRFDDKAVAYDSYIALWHEIESMGYTIMLRGMRHFVR